MSKLQTDEDRLWELALSESVGAQSALAWAKAAGAGEASARGAAEECAYPLGAFSGRLAWGRPEWAASRSEPARRAIAELGAALAAAEATRAEAARAWERFWMGHCEAALQAERLCARPEAGPEDRARELMGALGEEGVRRCAEGIARAAWRSVCGEDVRDGARSTGDWEPRGMTMLEAMSFHWQTLRELASRGLCPLLDAARVELALKSNPRATLLAISSAYGAGLRERFERVQALQERSELDQEATPATAKAGRSGAL